MKMLNRFNSTFKRRNKVKRPKNRSLKSFSLINSSAYLRRKNNFSGLETRKSGHKKKRLRTRDKEKMSMSVNRDKRFLSQLIKKSRRSQLKEDKMKNYTKNEILVDRASRIIKNLKGYLEKNGDLQK